MELLLKTSPGIEDLSLEECQSLLGHCSPLDVRWGEGRLYVSSRGDPYKLVAGARLLTGVSVVLLRERLECNADECGDVVERLARRVEWSRFLSWGESFAVRSERVGEFPLTSPQIASIVGRVVENAVSGVRVHLNSPSKVVVAEVDWGNLVLGIRLGGEAGLHRRWYRVREHMASLKPTLANAMLILSELRDGQRLLDPLCGGGTIPIEALLYHEWLEATCSDRSRVSAETAGLNAFAAGVHSRLRIIRSDVEYIHEKLGGRVDRIVTNPPYGLRVGNPRAALRVLGKLFAQAERILENGGRLTILFPRKEPPLELAERHGLDVIHERRVKHGDLDLWLLVFGAT